MASGSPLTSLFTMPDLVMQALEATNISVTISDLTRQDQPLVFVNQAFCDTTGYSRKDVIGKNCRFLQGEDTDPEVVKAIRDAITAGKPLSIQITNYRKDGEPFENMLDLSPITNINGDVIAFCGFQRDMSEAMDSGRAEKIATICGSLDGGNQLIN